MYNSNNKAKSIWLGFWSLQIIIMGFGMIYFTIEIIIVILLLLIFYYFVD